MRPRKPQSSAATKYRLAVLTFLAIGAGVTAIPGGAAALNRPIAVVAADPVTMYCPQEVRFDGSGSYHGDPGRRIVEHAWDFHYYGTFDQEATGVTKAVTYGEVGSFTAVLRVTDDGVPPKSHMAAVAVHIVNRPPVADAGGPYTVACGERLVLNAAASSDPDAPCADGIATYAWDLDGDGFYDDATGVAPNLDWGQVESLMCGGACAAGTSRNVQVRVTGRFGFSATAQTKVVITEPRVELTLTWPNGGGFLGTGRTHAIHWMAGPEVETVRVLLSRDRKTWSVIVPETKASLGLATWVPSSEEFRATGRNWLIKVQGFRNGMPVASDVSDAPFGIGPLDLREPKRAEKVPGGSTWRLRWARYGTSAPVAYTKIRHSIDGGKTWKTLRITGNPGEFAWKVPARRNRTEGCRVRVELYGAAGELLGRDAGQGPFTILGGVDLTSLEGGESVYGGTIRTVRWRTSSAVEAASVRLRATLDGGATWSDLATLAGNPRQWPWQVPTLPAAETSCRLEATLLDASGRSIAEDQGEGFFTILLRGDAYATAPPASITVPAASEAPAYTVAWGASPALDATYELQEAADSEFTVGIRTAYSGTLLSVPITGRENGGTYYYRVRALRKGWNPSVWVVGGNGCAVLWDETAPAPVSDFTATVVGNRINLDWVNPPDADLSGVRVLRRTDRFPTHAYDGTLVYNGLAQSFADVGLPAGIYYYAAYAYDAPMNYAAAATSVAEVIPSPSMPPTSITVPDVSYSGQYQLGWGASPTAGVTYELEEATDAAFVDGLRTAYSGSWLAIFLTGRKTYGITYYYRVRALGAGQSPSAWVAAANGCTVYWEGMAPDPVTDFTAIVVGNRINLAWVNPPDADYAGVRVLRRTDRFPTHAYDGTAVYDGPTQSFADVGLPTGAYYYAAFAYDASMNYAAAATAVADVIPSPPLPPASITVPAVSYPSQYQVRWGASPTAGVTYELEEATDAAFVDGLRTAYSGSWLSIFLTGRATYGITYYYRVRALGAGRSPSAWVEGANGCTVYWEGVAPGPVTGFTATVTGSRIYLTWVNPPDADYAGVRVLRRTDRFPTHAYDGTAIYDGPAQSFADGGLPAGTYYYAAYAHDASLNHSTPATATAVVTIGPQSVCEGCHNGDGDGDGIWTGVGYDPDGPGPLPAAPDVMGDGVDPGGTWPYRPYADGSWGFNANGHGSGARPAECADCHDIDIPAGTHLDGVLNSVEQKQNPNENTAHLRAAFIGGSAPAWNVQVTFDNVCLAAQPELGGCHDTAALRHRHTHNADPTPEAVRFGDGGSVDDGDGIRYPIDSDLSTNASTAEPDFAPCISCHNPHGTPLVDGWPTNRMLRDQRETTLCYECHL